MCKFNIMACVEQLPYGEVNIIKTLEEETVKALGQEKWNEIILDTEVPFDGMDPEKSSNVMRIFLNRYDELVPAEVTKSIFCRVMHGLKYSDFTWAREKFLQYNDIDKFCAAIRHEQLEFYKQKATDGEDAYGQLIDDAAMQFILDQPYMQYGARKANQIIAVGTPREMNLYLMETDGKKKRYYACDCDFVRNSILQAEGAVSQTMCNCSLGHTKVFWEAALDTPLSGKVESSVLGGDMLCRFAIDLPDSIMKKYVHTAV